MPEAGEGEPILEVTGLESDGLRVERLVIMPGESWCLAGGNSSGLARLAEILDGERKGVQAARLRLPARLGIVCFAGQQAIFEEEIRRDDTDWQDRLDPGTPARAFLTDIEVHRPLIEFFHLHGVLDRGYRQLSSGQARKLCLLAQLTRRVDLLVLENPNEGLDAAGVLDLDRVLAHLAGQGQAMLLLVNNSLDIPPWCSHLGLVRQGELALQGPRNEVEAEVRAGLIKGGPLFSVAVEELRGERRQPAGGDGNLITLRRGFARYGGLDVFSGLDMVVNRGDHTLITGPNGCGKSTLLSIFTGDHPLCYSNDLTLFGRRRGSGESVWELKAQMGIVSPDLHRSHRIPGSSLAVVVSGLFDSIGLYTSPSRDQERLARRWLARIGLAAKEAYPFRRLGYGEQRLVLLARALIKVPRLLILDEPTQGLDEANRKGLLDLLARIAAEELATILYVSHRSDEFRPFFRQRVRFEETGFSFDTTLPIPYTG